MSEVYNAIAVLQSLFAKDAPPVTTDQPTGDRATIYDAACRTLAAEPDASREPFVRHVLFELDNSADYRFIAPLARALLPFARFRDEVVWRITNGTSKHARNAAALLYHTLGNPRWRGSPEDYDAILAAKNARLQRGDLSANDSETLERLEVPS
jgi:hypothetical protein